MVSALGTMVCLFIIVIIIIIIIIIIQNLESLKGFHPFFNSSPVQFYFTERIAVATSAYYLPSTFIFFGVLFSEKVPVNVLNSSFI